MTSQKCEVLVISERERRYRFKDQTIKKRYDQADLVLCEDGFGRVIVLKDKHGVMK